MPKTASASVLPETCAMPQSSRTMVIPLAWRSQRARSALLAGWKQRAAPAAARIENRVRVRLRVNRRFFMARLSTILVQRANRRFTLLAHGRNARYDETVGL